jgi:dTDP-4-amino-4,6-dideoxygalactose transaminase
MHEEVREEIEAAWRDLVDRSSFIGGPAVSRFEAQFAAYCEAPFAVGVGSGTDALRAALQAVGVRSGDLVVTVPHTFIATVEAITQAGAAPGFVDINSRSMTMDPAAVRRYIERECVPGDPLIHRQSGRRVSCLLPVDLYGHPADWEPLTELAREFRLKVVEDACQAHGARYRGRSCGTFGDAAAFSFYPGKNLGAMGEAGAVVTADAEVAERCRILRDHGQRERYLHVTPDGSNARLDALQAAVLHVKLRHLDRWNERRRQAARLYAERLAQLDIIMPQEHEGCRHVYHVYAVRVNHRDEIRRHLESRGVGTGVHYPIPLHLQTAYRALGVPAGTFPVSESVASQELSLPMFPHLSEDQIERVVAELRGALEEMRPPVEAGH